MSSVKLQSQDLFNKIQEELTNELKTNPFATPGLKYLTINVGMGDNSSAEKEEILDFLAKLTSQKPQAIPSKKSIANFKSRKGETIGGKVTLRGQKAKDFLMQVVYIALPRTRDFKGISVTGFDKRYKSFSFGIPNASIFPSVGFTSKINFGLQINLIFKCPDQNNKLFLQKLNFPLKK